jgi:hypothetical protein
MITGEVSDLLRHARHISVECDKLTANLDPLSECLTDLLSGQYSSEFIGTSKAAWHSLSIQLQHLVDQIDIDRNDMLALIEQNKVYAAKKNEALQERIRVSQNVMFIFMSLFAPLAFFTAAYGQNFVKHDGTKAIPELLWGFSPSDPNDPTSPPVFSGVISGYGYFWILSGTTICTLLLVYTAMGLMYSPYELCGFLISYIKRKSVSTHTSSRES